MCVLLNPIQEGGGEPGRGGGVICSYFNFLRIVMVIDLIDFLNVIFHLLEKNHFVVSKVMEKWEIWEKNIFFSKFEIDWMKNAFQTHLYLLWYLAALPVKNSDTIFCFLSLNLRSLYFIFLWLLSDKKIGSI